MIQGITTYAKDGGSLLSHESGGFLFALGRSRP